MSFFSFSQSIILKFASVLPSQFDYAARDMFKNLYFPAGDTVFDFFIDADKDYVFTNWDSVVPGFAYSKDLPYFQLLVPTTDTTK